MGRRGFINIYHFKSSNENSVLIRSHIARVYILGWVSFLLVSSWMGLLGPFQVGAETDRPDGMISHTASLCINWDWNYWKITYNHLCTKINIREQRSVRIKCKCMLGRTVCFKVFSEISLIKIIKKIYIIWLNILISNVLFSVLLSFYFY